MRYTDLNTFKNDTERMNIIRERVSKAIYKRACKEVGADWCRYIPQEIGITPNASKVAKNTVVIDVGDVTTKDNFELGVCVEITVKVKKWNSVEKTKSGKTIYGVTLDDYDIALAKHRKDDKE